MNYVSNLRVAEVTSHWVCEIRKITEFPVLFLVKSSFPPVDTLKQMSWFQTNIILLYHADIKGPEWEILSPENIYLFKVNNRKSKEKVQNISKLIMKTPERLE